MARKLRIEFPGAVYHAYARGNERRPIFYGDEDRELFYGLLYEATSRFAWEGLTDCLMDNHLHLAIRTHEANLSRGMQWLLGSYSQKFNQRHSRSGHVFQGRFKDTLVQDGVHLSVLSRYIVLNPVRAGLVLSPDEYLWSSYRSAIGMEKPRGHLSLDGLLSNFGLTKKEAAVEYSSFVLAGIGEDSPDIYVPILGDRDYIASQKRRIEPNEAVKEFPIAQRQTGRIDLTELIPYPEKRCGENITRRNEGIIRAVMEHGYPQSEVARFVGLHCSRVSKMIAAEREKAQGKM